MIDETCHTYPSFKLIFDVYIMFQFNLSFISFFSPVRDAVVGGDAYTDGWEDSDYDVDGDVADAAVDDEALGLPSIPESQDDQWLK